jgi:hypothetical protein
MYHRSAPTTLLLLSLLRVVLLHRYDSGRYYNWNSPGFTPNAGHFTQLVWKATKKVGCAAQVCNTIAGFGQSGTLVVCRCVCAFDSSAAVTNIFILYTHTEENIGDGTCGTAQQRM